MIYHATENPSLSTLSYESIQVSCWCNRSTIHSNRFDENIFCIRFFMSNKWWKIVSLYDALRAFIIYAMWMDANIFFESLNISATKKNLLCLFTQTRRTVNMKCKKISSTFCCALFDELNCRYIWDVNTADELFLHDTLKWRLTILFVMNYFCVSWGMKYFK